MPNNVYGYGRIDLLAAYNLPQPNQWHTNPRSYSDKYPGDCQYTHANQYGN